MKIPPLNKKVMVLTPYFLMRAQLCKGPVKICQRILFMLDLYNRYFTAILQLQA